MLREIIEGGGEGSSEARFFDGLSDDEVEALPWPRSSGRALERRSGQKISSVAAYRREDLQNKNLGYPQGDLHRPHSERLACPSFGRCRNLIQAYPTATF